MSIYCQACNDQRDGVKGSPLTEHTCKGLDAPFLPNWVSPPCNTIYDILSERNISIVDFAKNMQMDVAQTARFMVNAQPITEDIAQKLSIVLGASPEFWLRREKQYQKSLKRISK